MPIVKNILDVEDVVVSTRHEALFEFLKETKYDVDPPASPYMEFPNNLLPIANRLVIRDCYDHLLPIVVRALKKKERVTVTGSPGIGKTLFGLVLLRELLLESAAETEVTFQAVVYWDKNFATALSFSDKFKTKFGLNQECQLMGGSLYMGSWYPTELSLNNFLVLDDVAVIHDPASNFTAAGTQYPASTTVFIISFGHELNQEWATKGCMPEKTLCMPVFEESEIRINRQNLFEEVEDDKIDELFAKFGGSIRHWGKKSEGSAWQEIIAKVNQVVLDGTGIAERTIKHRGSVVHLHVDFEKANERFPHENHNTFEDYYYVLASRQIANRFAASYQLKSTQELKSVLQTFAGEKGFEAVYGVLFEQYAHSLMRGSERDFNIRLVRHDGKNKAIYSSAKLEVKKTEVFPGRDPDVLTEIFAGKGIDIGTYLQPETRTFPTYDAILIVEGNAVGLEIAKVALLLQMTVSGASGLPRRPEHSVKRHVRLGLAKALNNTLDDFAGEDACYTTFCVPTVCFQPFLFQHEQLKDSEASTAESNQPEFQFVIEVPDFLHLPQADRPINEIHGTSGRMHRYQLRSGRDCKKLKTEELHGAAAMPPAGDT